MTEQQQLPPINGADSDLIKKMVDGAVSGQFDHYRMLQFWQRLLAGENDLEQIAQGLALALSSQRFIRNPGPGRSTVVNLTVTGNANPEAVAGTLKAALGLP